MKADAALKKTGKDSNGNRRSKRWSKEAEEVVTNPYTVVPELIDSKMTPQGLSLGAAVRVSGVHDIQPSDFTKVNPIYIMQH